MSNESGYRSGREPGDRETASRRPEPAGNHPPRTMLRRSAFIMSVLWLAFLFARFKAYRFGYVGYAVEEFLIAVMLGGLPAFVLTILGTYESRVSRTRACGLVFMLGILLGLSFTSLDQAMFKRSVEKADQEFVERACWWPNQDVTMVYRYGVYSVVG